MTDKSYYKIAEEEFESGKTFLNGWLSIPNSFTAEAMAKIGWDWDSWG